MQKFKSRKKLSSRATLAHFTILPNTASIDRRSTPLFWYKQRHPLLPFNFSPSLPLYLCSFSMPFSAQLPPRLHSERLSDGKCYKRCANSNFKQKQTTMARISARTKKNLIFILILQIIPRWFLTNSMSRMIKVILEISFLAIEELFFHLKQKKSIDQKTHKSSQTAL